MTGFQCDCGNNSGHTSKRQCAENRQATARYMASLQAANSGRMDALRAKHHEHLQPVHGCPACPLDGRFVRDSTEGEWYIPTQQ